MGLRLKLYAAVGIVALLLIGAIVFLFYNWRGAMQENAKLESQVQTLKDVNQENQDEINRILKENREADRAIANLLKEREQIIEDKNQELGEAMAELDDLRTKNETLDDFLNAPVPADFLNWLSRGGQDGDKAGAGATNDDRTKDNS